MKPKARSNRMSCSDICQTLCSSEAKKFDLRIYVLITSYAPLTVYLYRSGFARFSHQRFSMDNAELTNATVHLTNVAVQKHCDNYDEKRGGKWDLRHLKEYILEQEGPEKTSNLFGAIEDVVLFSLLSVQKVMIQDKHCFELYGYDIMIASDLKPWLIEVNASPSLTANTAADYEMKFQLLDDTITVLDLERYFTGAETQIGGFDLIYKGGARFGPPANALCRSYLGCHNNRTEQLRRLSRVLSAEEEEQQQQSGGPSADTEGAAKAGGRGGRLDAGRRSSSMREDGQAAGGGRGRGREFVVAGPADGGGRRRAA
eukprot:gnl/TRDRNA2_/TRDRNA2_61762_c1_seq1.p1 gnl/TRDRNA2_/TRDRNA2_61762_c1~~gnl/TRDRNA2_/TRDRNA2_61762_c1_seq1.p1  ORF type:complete len:315 (-),score=69.05 gnl/TRDRNA2_/TRDRNA2_61762_c1_seq1:83-1027(-)